MKGLHISENFLFLLKYTPLILYPYVSSKCFIYKIIYIFGGFEFFRLKVPQSPLYVARSLSLHLRPPGEWDIFVF